jgi:AcrR family transcriptional regulator
MDGSAAAKAQGRGRPPKNIDRHVIQDLMKAAEAALSDKTAKEITIHEIASAAGVNDAMIHYYFGGKDGLMVAIFEEIMRDAPYKNSERIIADCVNQESIRPLIGELCDFYYSRKSFIRMTIVEFISSSSKINAAYRNRYFDVTPSFVERVLESLVKSSIYNRSFDIKFVTSSIFSMIIGPIVLLSSTKVLSVSDQLYSGEWIDEISRLIDFSLKSPGVTAKPTLLSPLVL